MKNQSVESFLDDLFSNHAQEVKRSMQDKTYTYKLLDNSYFGVVKSGKCHVLDCSYSKSIDCNIYTIKDIDTGETIRANQFRLEIKEVH